MLGRKKEKTAAPKGPVVVDMENFELKNDRSVTRVRVFNLLCRANIDEIKEYIGGNDIIVVNLRLLRCSDEEFPDVTQELYRLSNLNGYEFRKSEEMLYLLIPKGVVVTTMGAE